MQTYRILPEGYNSLDDFHPLEQSAIFLVDSLILNFDDTKRRVGIETRIQILESTPAIQFLDYNVSHLTEKERKILAESKKATQIDELRELLK